MSQGVEDSEECLRLLQVNPNVFLHIQTPQGLFMIIHPLSLHCLSHRVNLFRTAQLSVQSINGQGSPTHWRLQFVPLSRHVYTRHQWEFPALPLYRPTQERGQDIWRIYILYRA